MEVRPVAVRVDDASQVGAARRAAVLLAHGLSFSEEDRTRVGIIATEMATNLLRHADADRWLLARVTDDAEPAGIELLAIDHGPGIGNLVQAQQDGFSTAGGAGQGLGAMRRLAENVDVISSAQGTVLLATLYPRLATTPLPNQAVGAVLVPMPGEEHCGDAWALLDSGEQRMLLVSDGLGHGELAGQASAAAVAAFRARAPRSAEDALAAVHQALPQTRGAAVAVAEIRAGLLRYAGLGNISGAIVTDDASRSLVSLHGTAGQLASRITAFEYPLERGALVILHSDGISARWDLASYPGITRRAPSVIAGVLFRDFARGRDDVCVAVYRVP